MISPKPKTIKLKYSKKLIKNMVEKCKICSEKIQETFLEKPKGTIIKIKKDDKTEKIYICSDCQKKYKEKIKEKIK